MRFLFCFTLLAVIFHTEAFGQTPAANPDVRIDSCPYNIIFVLDESGSISGQRLIDVETGAKALVAGVSGSGGRMAIIEFSDAARRASIGGSTAYQLVNSTFVANFNTYINGTGASTLATSYSPGGSTNWAAALNLVHTINIGAAPNNGLADLVIFFTDGDPTVGGNGVASANVVKADGSHIYVIAYATGGPSISRIEAISGTDRYLITSAGSFLTYDYSLSSTLLTPQCR